MSVTPETPRAQEQKVFICYRREHTAPYAGRLYDAMVARFGEDNVFMDVDMAPGVDFEERITQVVSGCKVLIIVMGPEWASATEADGGRRIDDPADFVRLEVETGLQRDDVTPIPVLVDGAQMPRREELPPGIRPIARRNAIELSNGRWSYDVGRLISALDQLLPPGGEGSRPIQPLPPPPSKPVGWGLALEGALVAGLGALIGRGLAEAVLEFKPAGSGEEASETAEHIVSEVVRRTWTLALVGALLGLWLALRARRGDAAGKALRGLALGALAGLVWALIWTLPVYLPTEKAEFERRALVELVALAIGGGLLGMGLSSLWGSGRRAAGFAAGMLGGFAFALAVFAANWKTPTPGARDLAAFLGIALIVALTLAALLALDRGEARKNQALAGSPRSGASHSAGSTGGVRPG